jgi:lysophospholipase L1-like esterase
VRRPPTILFKVALAISSVVIVMGSAEWVARSLGEFEGTADPLDAGDMGYFAEVRQYDPLLFWSLEPGGQGTNGLLKLNSHGLRGPEISEHGENEYRILSLGESSTFAGRAKYKDCYSARLEKLLGRINGRRVRVINAGVPGYTLFQGYQYLIKRGLEFNPDAVLLYFGFNDFLPVSYLANRTSQLGRGMNDREMFAMRDKTVRRFHDEMMEYSHLYRALRVLLLEKVTEPAELELEVDEERFRVPEEDRRWLLSQILDNCASRGIQLIICVPWYVKFENHAPLLREFALEHDLPLVDLPNLLRKTPFKPREDYFLDRVHPTAEGHALIAEAIRNELMSYSNRR